MAERVPRETIATEVIATLAAVSRKSDITENSRLLADLKMGPTVRRAMALPYSQISAEHGGIPISMGDAEKLKTVKASIDLVHKKANS